MFQTAVLFVCLGNSRAVDHFCTAHEALGCSVAELEAAYILCTAS